MFFQKRHLNVFLILYMGLGFVTNKKAAIISEAPASSPQGREVESSEPC